MISGSFTYTIIVRMALLTTMRNPSKIVLSILIMSVTAATLFAQETPPRTAQDFFDEGVRLIKESDHNGALTAFRESLRLQPQQPEAYANIGSVLIFLKRPEEAVTAYREAIRLKPNEGSFHTGLCVALSEGRKHTEAISACQEGIRKSPASGEAQLTLLSALDRSGRPDSELMTAINSALSRFANDSRLKGFAAFYAMRSGRPEASVPFWEDLVRAEPTSSYYAAQLAIALLLVEREAEALGYAKRSLEINPQDLHAQYFMGRLFLELGQHNDAVAAFRRAMNAQPSIRDANYQLAVALDRLGRQDLAVEEFQKAIALDPDGFTVNYEFGRLLGGMGRFEEAIGPHRKALALQPNNFAAKVGLGLVLFESTNFEEALKHLEDADRQKPGDSVVMMFLGVTRQRQQSIPRINEMKQFAKTNPQNTKIRVQLIQLLSYARRIDEAEPYVQEFFELKPVDPRLYQSVAVAYSTSGFKDKALDVYLRSLEIGEDAGTHFGIANLYGGFGKYEEASAAWIKGFALRSDVPGFLTLYGHHLRDAGKRREALEAFKRALALQPMNEAALANAAVLSGRLGEMDAARVYVNTLGAIDPARARRIERCLPYLRVWL